MAINVTYRNNPQPATDKLIENDEEVNIKQQAKKKFIGIGSHPNGMVMLNVEKSGNSHIAITGKSGSGKSVAGQKLIRNIASGGKSSIVVLDFHRLFCDENIFSEYRENIKKYSKEIDAYSSGISVPLFTPLKNAEGRKEDRLDVVTSITGVLSNALKLGGRQQEFLFEAVDFVAETDSYSKYGTAALGRALDMLDDDKAAIIQDKLRYILRKNVFRDGPIFIEDKKINILRLAQYPESTQLLIVEIVLTYIWRLANTGAFMKSGLCLFLDECQNLNWGKTGVIRAILSEGRKMGVQLIMITQALGGNGRSDIKHCLLQAGTQLYFSPPEDETPMVAKLIGAKRYAYWQMRLKTLEVGECVVSGSLIVNQVPYNGALKIKI